MAAGSLIVLPVIVFAVFVSRYLVGARAERRQMTAAPARARRAILPVMIAVLSVVAGDAALAAVPTGETVDGIHCDAAEGVALHIHPHLTILDHGKPVGIPEDVGRPIAGQCFYWLHTHTPDGIIHVESPTFRTFTLGEFFAIWGQPLTPRDVAGAKPRPGERIVVFVDGDRYTGDPRAIEFAQHLDIDILVGPPYTKPPPFTAWHGN